MPSKVITRVLNTFGGKNSRDNDIGRDVIFCRDSLNVALSQKNACQSRSGVAGVAKGAGGGGIATYLKKDISNSRVSEELISIDSACYRLKQGYFTVSYVGTEATRFLSIIPIHNTDGSYSFHCQIQDGASLVLDQNLGRGINEISPFNVGSLVTAINALPTFNATVGTGTTSGPAAFIPSVEGLYVESAGIQIQFWYWERIFSPVSSPFSSFWGTLGSSAFENASLENCDDQLFIATGYNELYCYDSRACYRAGMPRATTLSGAQAAGGSLTALATYEYMITYEFTNEVGKVIEGDESNRVQITLTGGNQTVNLTIPIILNNSGFFTHCGIMTSGGGVSTNVLSGITNGHCAKAGDVVYFYSGGSLINRAVISTTATTITCGGAAFTYTNNYPVMLGAPQIKINIWRSAAGDTDLKYLVTTLTNDVSVPATTTLSYSDTLADATLIGNATYDPPIKHHSLPPSNLKYLAVYNTLLCGSKGDDEIWYSDWDGPHYFPEGESGFTIRSKTASRVTGLKGTRELLCATKESETHISMGDFPSNQFRQEMVADAIGCDAHATMSLIDDVLLIWSGLFGARQIYSSGPVIDWSDRIVTDWSQIASSASEEFIPRRAVSLVDARKQKLYLYIPCEDSNLPNENSVTYVCDYRDHKKTAPDGQPMVRWWPLSNINMHGGACLYRDAPFFMERRWSPVLGTVEYILSTFSSGGTGNDFCDHAEPYPVRFEGTWYSLDEPSSLKKWLKTKLFNLEGSITQDSSFRLEIESNFINGVPTNSKEFLSAPETSLGWGYSGWGYSAWGDLGQRDWRMDLSPIEATAIKVVISNEELWKQQLTFDGVEIELVPAYDLEMADR